MEPYSIFKALADPSRRQLLDLMRERPRTTGELAARLSSMTRFGVMKHLDVLERAGLVVVRRSGRKRFNHLNAVPIRQVYQRWVGKYAGLQAASLMNLKELAEGRPADSNIEKTGEPPMSVSKQDKGKAIDSFEIAQEIAVAAPREKVWDALTRDVGKWWAFRIADGEVTLDATLGGQFVERNGDDGAIWGTVVLLKRAEKLQLSGPLGFVQRPINSLYRYELEDRNGGTLLKLTHTAYGQQLGEMGDDYNKGWQHLLGHCLKAFVEAGKTHSDLTAEADSK